MSLMNETLRDLDMREMAFGAERLDRNTASRNFPASARRIPWALGGLLGLALLGWAFFKSTIPAGETQQHLPTHAAVQASANGDDALTPVGLSDNAQLIVPVKSQAATKARPGTLPELNGLTTDAASSIASTATEKATAKITDQATAKITTQQAVVETRQIQALLFAENALANDRLTVPWSDSALYYLQQVLAEDAQNTDALLGLEKIQQRYRELIASALQHGNLARAESLLASMETVQRSDPRADASRAVTEIRDQLRAFKLELGMPAAQVNQRDTIVDEPVSVSVSAPASAAPLNIQNSSQQQLRDALDAARSLVARGDYTRAIQILSAEQGSSALHQQLDDYLVRLYLETGMPASALRVLTVWDERQQPLYYARARYLQHSQGDLAAYQYLDQQSFLPADAKALYAAFLQREQRFEEAQYHYQSLAREQPDNAAFWLGLALSSERLNSREQAQGAYERALAIGGLAADVEAYVRERLSLLVVASRRPPG